MSSWININDEKPPEDKAVLAYTEDDVMKVVKLRHGVFDTYMKVIAWQFLPKDKPDFTTNCEEKKKRGRPKKNV